MAEQAEATLDADVAAADPVGKPFLDWLRAGIRHLTLKGDQGASATAQRELALPSSVLRERPAVASMR
jgi:hypothetical protein